MPSYYNFSEDCKATPSTIWLTCFDHMKLEIWDTDVKQVLNVSGGCETGTTFIFDMKSGQKIKCTLFDVIKNERLTFKGSFLGGLGNFEGTIKLTPTESSTEVDSPITTKIDYKFGFGGFMGPLLNLMAGKEAEHGTKQGLENMIQLSEEAQQQQQQT